MYTTPLLTALCLILLTNCTTNQNLPTPNYSISACQAQHVELNFAAETYALNDMPFEHFNQKVVGWIPDETEPTFYIISYQMLLCDHLELSIENYTFQLEEIGNPDGYWYEVTTTEEIFAQLLNGEILKANFKKWVEVEEIEMEVGLATY